MRLEIMKTDPRAVLPVYSSDSASGADLFALGSDEITIAPHETVMIHTGIAVRIPEGYTGLVCARSGLACKRSLAPANKVGVIDPDYRGEIMVALHDHSDLPATIRGGERIAQLLIVPCPQCEIAEVASLDDTARGSGGFGSTGK